MITGISRHLYEKSLGILLLRVGVGLVFVMHGLLKVQNPGMAEGFFMHMGFPPGVGTAIGYLELVGGIAIILGIATRLFAFLLAIEMLVAIFVTGGIEKGWQPHELEALLMTASLALVYIGSGRFSLWRMECQHCGGMMCRVEDCPKRKGR